MPAGKTLRSFHIENWMERELKFLALVENINKAELMRRMIYFGLTNSWETRPPNNQHEPRVIDNEVPERNEVRPQALAALEHAPA